MSNFLLNSLPLTKETCYNLLQCCSFLLSRLEDVKWEIVVAEEASQEEEDAIPTYAMLTPPLQLSPLYFFLAFCLTLSFNVSN